MASFFKSFQNNILNKALGLEDKKASRPQRKKKRRKTPDQVEDDAKSLARRALEEAEAKLNTSGDRMDKLLDVKQQDLEKFKAAADKAMTPERKALIAQAQKIRKQKAKILDDLDDEAKAKLYLMAMRTFMGDK